LTNTQLNAIGAMDVFGTAQVAAFSSQQFSTLDVGVLQLLTTAQLAALGAAQAAGLTTEQLTTLSSDWLAKLSTRAVASLNSVQLDALQADDIQALRTTQIAGLTTLQIQALNSSQIAAFGSDQIRALKAAQIGAIGTAQLVQMTVEEFAAFSSAQVKALSTTQVAALTPDQRDALGLVSPLVLDLDGNGVRTLGLSSGVRFDIAASGRDTPTGWVDQGDGLLALDRNHDGRINDGSELFGTATASAAGGKSKDGFAALSDLDSNKDGRVDSQDAAFGDLRVWVDTNADGVSQDGELKTLDALGIASLSTTGKSTSVLDNGNWVGLESDYTTTDGQQHALADVWFQTSLRGRVSALSQAMAGYASAADTAQAGGTLSLPSGNAGDANALSGQVAALAQQLEQFRLPSATGAAELANSADTDWYRRSPPLNGILAAK
jgi:hypothetical protein